MPTLREHLQTFRVLSLFAAFNFGFWAFGFDRVFRATVKRAGSKNGPECAGAWGSAEVSQAAAAVRRATMLYYRRNKDCLPRSLALYYLLRRRGVPATIRIGIAKYPFHAHAWVEVNGQPVEAMKPEHSQLRVLLSA